MNSLDLGTSRVGTLYDFDPSTPLIGAVLERLPEGIRVTVSWTESDIPCATWFIGDDPTFRRSTEPPAVPCPRRLLFEDSHGSLLLIGCRARGFHADLMGPGYGRVWAEAAIKGVTEDVDFGEPHALRSEISGLREWLGTTSWRTDISRGTAGPAVTMRSDPSPPVELAAVGSTSTSLVPRWEVKNVRSSGEMILRDEVQCQTISPSPLPWAEHKDVHRAVRDLLLLSRWRRESQVVVHASRDDDPWSSGEGPRGRFWRDVLVAVTTSETPTGHIPHLIRFGDVGPTGIRRWIDLRDTFSRALDPVISSKDLQGASAETLLAHTGPGLEALAFLVARRAGLTKNEATDEKLKDGLDRVAAPLGEVLPDDAAGWVSRFTSAYNKLKHANRSLPNPVDAANAWREAVLVTRTWVALELGVEPGAVRERLLGDHQRHAFVPRD